MELDTELVIRWLGETAQILQKFSIVVVIAVIAMRFEWLRQALRGAVSKRRDLVTAIFIFSLLAIFGTYNGIVINTSGEDKSTSTIHSSMEILSDNQTVVGFRDTVTLSAGMLGGPIVGLGTGIISGMYRYHFGGHAGLPSAIGTVFLGFFAGVVRYFRPQCLLRVSGVFWVTFIGTLLHRLLLLSLMHFSDEAKELCWHVGVPVLLTNTLGCVILFWVILDLDRENLKNEAKEARLLSVQAGLRAMRAQVDPHFLNNTLGDLISLIHFDSEKAKRYVYLLAKYFRFTRKFTDRNTISLAEEAAQVLRFLVLQRLEYGNRLQYGYDIPKELRRYQVLPGCVLTMVENAFKHGFKGKKAPYILHISAQKEGQNLWLSVTDNGLGIPPERMELLGKCDVKSDSNGGGVALHQLVEHLNLLLGHEVASLNFQSTVEQGTVVTLKQPKIMG